MNIGGLQKLTTLDFPGVVSAVVFTQGCNFCCPYCHNPWLLPARGAGQYSEADLMAFLRKRQGILGGIVISGGEPTMQPDLLDFCRTLKNLKYKVKVDSNGSNPKVLQDLIAAAAVDYIAIDLKAPLGFYSALSSAPEIEARVSDSVKLVKSAGIPHELRTTCVSPFINADALHELCKVAGSSPWYLQAARLKNVLRPDFSMQALPHEELESILPLLRKSAPNVALRA